MIQVFDGTGTVRSGASWGQSVGAALLVHAGALLTILGLPHRATTIPPEKTSSVEVRMVEAGRPSVQPTAAASRPLPRQPENERRPAPAPRQQPTERHIEPSAISAPAVASQSTAAPVAAPPQVESLREPPPSLAEARFDADYLHNPRPAYPPASRRMGESGTVHLRVQVGEDGSALQVSLKHSSGYPRLDRSAMEVVSNWRFVPARRGGEAVVSWVVVPVAFELDQ